MRLFACILSIFVLVLSLVPCSDNENCEDTAMELSSGHADHDHEEDSCTPFCNCSCCGVPVVLATPVFYEVVRQVKIQIPAITHYNSDFTSSYFYSFWQPPRI